MLVVGAASMFGVNAPLEVRRGIALAIAAAYFIAYPYFQRRSIARHISSLYPERDVNRGILGDHELEILSDGFVDRTPVGEHRLLWGGIDRIKVDSGRLYIHVGSGAACIVPEARVTEGDYDAFVRALRQRWEEHRSVSEPVAADNVPAGATRAHRVMERVAGLVLLMMGLALGGLALWAVERQLTFGESAQRVVWIMCGAFGLIAVFCTGVGYRLLFNRPNKDGSLLPSSAWGIVAGLFLLIGLVLLAVAIHQRSPPRCLGSSHGYVGRRAAWPDVAVKRRGLPRADLRGRGYGGRGRRSVAGRGPRGGFSLPAAPGRPGSG